MSADNVKPVLPEDGGEILPTHTAEFGTLKKLPNSGTAWLGSSSGVYFVNTVRRAFSTAFAANSVASNAIPNSEDILLADDEAGASGQLGDGANATDEYSHMLSAALGRMPERNIGMKLVVTFFQNWHPLFPFLHGPTFLKDVDTLYKTLPSRDISNYSRPNMTRAEKAAELRKFLTFQLVINIADLDVSENNLSPENTIKSSADVTRLAGSMALNHDIATIQLLLAAELYLVVTFSIRPASTVSGIVIRLLYHAGLHRCPLRYAQLAQEECEIRKRIFWTAYALDRHCSLSLGDPITVQDSDIDVCVTGRELHRPVSKDVDARPEHVVNLHRPGPPLPTQKNPAKFTISASATAESSNNTHEQARREAALTAYLKWSQLTGRIVEIFHKSLNYRFPRQEEILFLTSDIETWWNDLPGFLTGEDTSESTPLQNLSSFFKVLYHRLLLLFSRPRLSLDQSTPEFQHGLQVCIRASRNILAGLKGHQSKGQSMFLPGLISASWMSGLIIAFACQLGKYPKARACSDIHACLFNLEAMNLKHYAVQNCHKVLSLLLSNIQSRKASTNGFLAVAKSEQSSTQAPPPPPPPPQQIQQQQQSQSQPSLPPPLQPASSPPLDENSSQVPRKRRRTAGPEKPIHIPPTVSAPASMTTTSHTITPSTNTNDIKGPNSATSYGDSPSSRLSISDPTADQSIQINPSSDFSQLGFFPSDNFSHTTTNQAINWGTGQPVEDYGLNPGHGAAIYANPQDMASAQWNMTLPEVPENVNDPMFWSNIDYNLADIFGSATWENMTGPFAPGWDTTGL